MKEMWDQRYSDDLYAYGTEPNVFFKDTLHQYQPKGRLLLPAEGEGRNAVYAASQGFDVVAFDISEQGRRKANLLANENQVSIQYEVGDFLKMDFQSHSFDVLGLIYTHFPPQLFESYVTKLNTLLKPGALVILEGFSKNNLPLRKKNPNVGGPDNEDLLYSTTQISRLFKDYETCCLEEVTTNLKEGMYHNGVASVVRYIGRKPTE